MVLDVISGFWMAYRVKSENAEKEDKEAEEKPDAEKGPKLEIPAEDSRQWCLFNMCMVFNTLYLAMMASAWYSGDFTVRPTQVADFASNTTLWIHFLSIVVGYLLFLYILFAPAINPGRSY